MLRMGVDPAAVELRMRRDGRAPHEVARVLGAPKATSPPRSPAREDARLGPYVKMRKVGVLAESVVARMRLDGLPADLIERFARAQAPHLASATPAPARKPKRRATIALHWEKMDGGGDRRRV